MSWVRKKSLPAIESISYENCPCNTLPDLWNTERGKRDVYCDKQVEKAVTVLNYILKSP